MTRPCGAVEACSRPHLVEEDFSCFSSEKTREKEKKKSKYITTAS